MERIKQSHRESLNRQSTRVGITLCCVLPIVIAVIIAVVIVVSVLVSLDSEPTRTTPAPTSTARLLPSTSTPRVPIPGFGDGVWRVGRDIEPGTYRSPGLDLCYWERLSGFSGTSDDLITNGIGDFEMIVTVKETDRGFLSDGCHWWTLIDP